jgi:prevent-host-death family protein
MQEPKKVNMAIARARFPELIKKVEAGEVAVVGRYGRPVAVILSFEKFREMEEDIEDLKAVIQMEREIAQNGITGPTLDEYLAEVRAKPDSAIRETAAS